ncbi:MAG: hypothetical protein INR62_09005 [Rhodospirillales bacterium]|nr:hypothetical protein [Acetobacter sp.]
MNRWSACACSTSAMRSCWSIVTHCGTHRARQERLVTQCVTYLPKGKPGAPGALHFVVEMADALLVCETKARNELGSAEVLAKAEAGALWCQRASQMGASAKPWKYLLIPHDQVTEDKRLQDHVQSCAGAAA